MQNISLYVAILALYLINYMPSWAKQPGKWIHEREDIEGPPNFHIEEPNLLDAEKIMEENMHMLNNNDTSGKGCLRPSELDDYMKEVAEFEEPSDKFYKCINCTTKIFKHAHRVNFTSPDLHFREMLPNFYHFRKVIFYNGANLS